MEIINLRLNEDVKKKIELLVSKGIFSSRSEALRKMLEDHLAEHPELFATREIDDAMLEDFTEEELLEVCSILFSGKKTAAELVREGRGV
ncbi:MAG: ribbon-helix-helix domain-containing protein [Candidatus Bathyarchaeia archaeon]